MGEQKKYELCKAIEHRYFYPMFLQKPQSAVHSFPAPVGTEI